MATETGGRRGVYIGLGANLGDPPAQLREALRRLAATPGVSLRRISRAWRTPPWGVDAQPPFTNAVAELETTLGPAALLQCLLAVERAGGRERGGLRWGPRLIDLDLLLDGDAVVDLPGCQVPHPRLRERAFVLVPLAELAPDAIVPGAGTVSVLLAALDPAERAAVTPLADAIDPRAPGHPSSTAPAR